MARELFSRLRNLDERQLDMATLIFSSFQYAGYPDPIAAAAVVNAYAESGLDPDAEGDCRKRHGEYKCMAVGLFQLREDGHGFGMTKEMRKNPEENILRTLAVFQSWAGKPLLRAWRKGVKSVADLSALFSTHVQRPAEREKQAMERARLSRVLFGSASGYVEPESEPEAADTGEPGISEAAVDTGRVEVMQGFGATESTYARLFNLERKEPVVAIAAGRAWSAKDRGDGSLWDRNSEIVARWYDKIVSLRRDLGIPPYWCPDDESVVDVLMEVTAGEGFDPRDTDAWLDAVHRRVARRDTLRQMEKTRYGVVAVGPIASPEQAANLIDRAYPEAGHDVALEVVRVANSLGTNPFWLADLINFESRWDPLARNPRSSATGLIQWIRSRAREIGLDHDGLMSMSAVEQMRWVERDLGRWRGKLGTKQALYMAVFQPSKMYVPVTASFNFDAKAQAANPGIYKVSDYLDLVDRHSKLYRLFPATRHARVSGPVARGKVVTSTSEGSGAGLGFLLLAGLGLLALKA